MEKSNKIKSWMQTLGRQLLAGVVLLIGAGIMSAAPIKVTGTVTSAQDGEPLIGASVFVVGTTTGASTDIDGNYTISAEMGQTLRFSYVGMNSREIKVTGSKLDVVLTLNADKNATLTVTLTQAGGGAANSDWPDYPKGDEIGETATEAAGHIYAGWNIGNTMEVPAGETGWGNPMGNQALIDGVAKAGFNAVRIPLSWGAAQKLVADAEPWTIKEDWLNRVKEVVDYCYSRGLYVIINCHWDGGWLELHANMTDGPAVARKEAAIWTQIADKFKDYGQRLIFAGNNEIRNTRNGNEWWGEPNADECEAVDLFNQTFVDAVRATGGNNAQRNLVVQSYCCNPWYALNKTAMPSDPAQNHLMINIGLNVLGKNKNRK